MACKFILDNTISKCPKFNECLVCIAGWNVIKIAVT